MAIYRNLGWFVKDVFDDSSKSQSSLFILFRFAKYGCQKIAWRHNDDA